MELAAMSMEMEASWLQAESVACLPPLREVAAPSSSSFSRPSSTMTSFHSSPSLRASTPLTRSGTPAGSITVSRIDRCPLEGRALGLPSEAEQNDERRNTSPRGMAAYVVGRGPYGSSGDELWRVKRRSLKPPLVPIEETLRKRRVLRTSMSAPAMAGERPGEMPGMCTKRDAGEMPGSPSLSLIGSRNTVSMQSNHLSVTGRRRKHRSRELADASSQSSWAGSEGSYLVSTCLKLCAYEDDLQLGGANSSVANLSGWLQTPSASPSASCYDGGKSFSPSKAKLFKPLPSELLDRMKDCGWAQKDLGTAVWVEKARQLTSSPSAAPAAAGCRGIQERLQLLEVLEQQAVPQGPEALRAALRWRCGSLEQAFQCLDVSDRNGQGSLSMLELAGAVALLGLDAPALCGTHEVSTFAAMDADLDGRLSIYDLLGTSAPAPTWCDYGGSAAASPQRASSKGTEGGAARWVFTAKFVALSAWFGTPQLIRRRLRPPPVGSGQSVAPIQLDRPETAAGGAITVVTALAGAATGGASIVNNLRQQVIDPVRQSWAPSEADFEAIDGKMQEEFARNASGRQLSEQVINKSDFFRLLGDIPPMGIGNDPDAHLTRAQLSDIFDMALSLQVQSMARNGITFSKGLTFESFRLALLKVCLSMGLHFRHLVEDAIDAQVQACLAEA